MSTTTTETNEPQLLKLEGLNESLKVLVTALNKATKSGVFDSVDDAYLVRVSLSNVEVGLKNLEKHQNLYIARKQAESQTETKTD